MAKQYFVFFKDLVTRTKDGIMRKEDKIKLDNIQEEASKTIVDSALSKTSKNPVQNSVIAAELEALKKSGSDGKKNVAAAITGMGVPTATDADFSEIVENIEKIGGDANISAGDVLSGKTAYAKGEYITGSMPNHGAKTAVLDCEEYYIIPAGYHNGAGRVFANSLASQTEATAGAGDILSGKTAYVNGSKITGNIPSKAAATYTPGTTNQEIAAGQYLSGKQVVKGDSNLIAANIKKGVSIFGVTGNMEADKTHVMLGNIFKKQFETMQHFERYLYDYKGSLSNGYYTYWYSTSIFETASISDSGLGGLLPDHTTDTGNHTIIRPLETYILFETGECLRLYLNEYYDTSGTLKYEKSFQWINNQTPTSFSIKVFYGTTETLSHSSYKDNDTWISSFNIYPQIVVSKNVGFYVIPISMGGKGMAGPSYRGPLTLYF